MPSELPASALYSHPSLGRLWRKVHLAYSPFLRRQAVRLLYQKPAPTIRAHLSLSYDLIALGCAHGAKEALLLQKLPPPASLLAADANLPLARRAVRRLSASKKSARSLDLTADFSFPRRVPASRPTLFTLFGVLPNLHPLPLFRRLRRVMRPADLLLFSANLAPGLSSRLGALRVLPQYDNPPTRFWLSSALRRARPQLTPGHLEFGVFPDPQQKDLFRIQAHWSSKKNSLLVFSSRRPTSAQVEAWLRSSRLHPLARWLEPRGEEGVWLVQLPRPPFPRDPKAQKR